MKCANCELPAAFVYRPAESSQIPFCMPHVPSFLVPRMKAGLLEKAESFDSEVASAVTAVNELFKEPVVEEEPKKPVSASSKKTKKSSDVQTDE